MVWIFNKDLRSGVVRVVSKTKAQAVKKRAAALKRGTGVSAVRFALK